VEAIGHVEPLASTISGLKCCCPSGQLGCGEDCDAPIHAVFVLGEREGWSVGANKIAPVALMKSRHRTTWSRPSASTNSALTRVTFLLLRRPVLSVALTVAYAPMPRSGVLSTRIFAHISSPVPVKVSAYPPVLGS
jgi:hypothetical protein